MGADMTGELVEAMGPELGAGVVTVRGLGGCGRGGGEGAGGRE